jgi:hypothetical protein
MFKALYISLILVNGDILREELFDTTCARFFKEKVQVIEQKNTSRYEPRTIHKYKGFQVVGYWCSDVRAE